MLRWLGLSKETRVHISAPGIDVVLAGEPKRVRRLLGVITDALEKGEGAASRRFLPRSERELAAAGTRRASQVVEPSELDEMDSPYALPEAEALVRSADEVLEADRTYELPGRNLQARRRRAEVREGELRAPPRAPSLAIEEGRGSERPTRLPTPDAALERTPVDPDDPDPERTAVELHPASEVPGGEVEITDTRVPGVAPTSEPPSSVTVEAPRLRGRRSSST